MLEKHLEGQDDLVGPNGQRKKRVVILLSANRSQTIGVLLSHLKVCGCVYVYVCLYVCIYVWTRVGFFFVLQRTHTHTHMHVHVHVCIVTG